MSSEHTQQSAQHDRGILGDWEEEPEHPTFFNTGAGLKQTHLVDAILKEWLMNNFNFSSHTHSNSLVMLSCFCLALAWVAVLGEESTGEWGGFSEEILMRVHAPAEVRYLFRLLHSMEYAGDFSDVPSSLELTLTDPLDGCKPLENAAEVQGRAALMKRGYFALLRLSSSPHCPLVCVLPPTLLS